MKNSNFNFHLLIFCFLLFASVPTVHAVKHGDFKRCDQSGFCVRNRAYADLSPTCPYSILTENLQFDPENGEIKGKIHSSDANVLLSLSINFYEDSIVRVRITEVEELRKRYKVKDVLIDEGSSLRNTRFTYKEQGKGVYLIEYAGLHSALLKTSPFGLDIFKDGVHIVSTNKKGWMNFEHYRVKPAVDESSNAETANDPLKKGMWEESFNSFSDSKKYGPSSISMDFSFIESDNVYGIPEHASNFSLKTTRGGNGQDSYSEPYRLFNLDVFEFELNSPMALYGSVPFLMSHKVDTVSKKSFTAGLFWLNAAETWVDVTKEIAGSSLVNQDQGVETSTPSTVTHWMSESGMMDFFIMTGSNPKEVSRYYAMLTGSSSIPPSFSLGYHQCRWNYMDTAEVDEVNKGFEQHDIPMDVIWLDIEHTDDKKYFTWHKTKFIDHLNMQKNIASYSRKMVTIIDPHIKRDDKYHVKQMTSEKGLFVKNKDGGEYDGWCWSGSSSWIDFTNPDARRLWGKFFSYDTYKGSTSSLFTWNDMNEPSVFNGPEITMPKDNIHWQDWEHRDVHNIYGMYLHRSTSGGQVLRNLPTVDGNHHKWENRADALNGPKPHRPFVLSRAFFAGTQRYGAIWTGDNMATWSHLESAAPMLLSISLAGVNFCGVDVGGFFMDPTPELITRWYQAGIYYPFFRGHAHLETRRREPWVYGEPYLRLIRDAIITRYQILPYWYTLFRQAQLRGTPPLRPIFMEFPMEENTFKFEQQYMVGDSLMVRPITKSIEDGGTTIDVVFVGPEMWYDFHSHFAYKAGLHVTFSGLTLEHTVPSFIRAGKIIPLRMRVRRSTMAATEDPLTLVSTLDSRGEANGEYYLDDGESFMYAIRGEFVHQQVHVTVTETEIKITSKNILYDDKDADIEKKTRLMKAWQRPFISDELYENDKLLQDWNVTYQAMNLMSNSKYRQSFDDKIKIEKIIIVGVNKVLESWLGTSNIRSITGIISKNGEKLKDLSIDTSMISAEKVVGNGDATVPATRLTFKKPNVGAGLDFDLSIKK